MRTTSGHRLSWRSVVHTELTVAVCSWLQENKTAEVKTGKASLLFEKIAAVVFHIFIVCLWEIFNVCSTTSCQTLWILQHTWTTNTVRMKVYHTVISAPCLNESSPSGGWSRKKSNVRYLGVASIKLVSLWNRVSLLFLVLDGNVRKNKAF